MKGSLLFISGAAIGIIGTMLADSPVDPFYKELETKECQQFFANQLNITEEEFVKRLEQVKSMPQNP